MSTAARTRSHSEFEAADIRFPEGALSSQPHAFSVLIDRIELFEPAGRSDLDGLTEGRRFAARITGVENGSHAPASMLVARDVSEIDFRNAIRRLPNGSEMQIRGAIGYRICRPNRPDLLCVHESSVSIEPDQSQRPRQHRHSSTVEAGLPTLAATKDAFGTSIAVLPLEPRPRSKDRLRDPLPASARIHGAAARELQVLSRIVGRTRSGADKEFAETVKLEGAWRTVSTPLGPKVEFIAPDQVRDKPRRSGRGRTARSA
jgi:hypothetical protein